MHSLLHFLQTEPVFAFLIASLIFFITLFLVVKQWIGFSITFLLLVFALAAGIIINNQKAFQGYADDYHTRQQESQQDAFKKQILQAVENLKVEVESEKENLRQVMTQVQTIFEQVDVQKQKLQNFIEEAKDHFKADAKQIEDSSTSESSSLSDHSP